MLSAALKFKSFCQVQKMALKKKPKPNKQQSKKKVRKIYSKINIIESEAD